jgi:hypothetical protein
MACAAIQRSLFQIGVPALSRAGAKSPVDCACLCKQRQDFDQLCKLLQSVVSARFLLRGAVNSVFIGASNQLGEFESGAVAAWLGTVPSVVIGGLGQLPRRGTVVAAVSGARAMGPVGGGAGR